MWDIVIPTLTFLTGILVGGFGASKILKQQMKKMQSDPTQIQAMARSMGMNLSQKQLNTMTRQMQNSSNKKNLSKKKNSKKKK